MSDEIRTYASFRLLNFPSAFPTHGVPSTKRSEQIVIQPGIAKIKWKFKVMKIIPTINYGQLVQLVPTKNSRMSHIPFANSHESIPTRLHDITHFNIY